VPRGTRGSTARLGWRARQGGLEGRRPRRSCAAAAAECCPGRRPLCAAAGQVSSQPQASGLRLVGPLRPRSGRPRAPARPWLAHGGRLWLAREPLRPPCAGWWVAAARPARCVPRTAKGTEPILFQGGSDHERETSHNAGIMRRFPAGRWSANGRIRGVCRPALRCGEGISRAVWRPVGSRWRATVYGGAPCARVAMGGRGRAECVVVRSRSDTAGWRVGPMGGRGRAKGR